MWSRISMFRPLDFKEQFHERISIDLFFLKANVESALRWNLTSGENSLSAFLKAAVSVDTLILGSMNSVLSPY